MMSVIRLGSRRRRWMLPGGLRVEARDGLLGAPRGPAVGRARRVDRLDEGVVGAAARVGLRLEQVVHALVAEAIDLRRGERRLLRDLGGERERGREPLGRHLDADRQAVPAGLGVERRAEPLRGLGQRDRVVLRGALGQGPGHEGRDSGLLRGLVDRAAREDQRGGHERPPGQVDRDQPEPVRELLALEPRELVGPRLAVRRAVGDHDRAGLRWRSCRGHSALVTVSLPAAGTYVRTARFSATNTSALTSRICSAVVDR